MQELRPSFYKARMQSPRLVTQAGSSRETLASALLISQLAIRFAHTIQGCHFEFGIARDADYLPVLLDRQLQIAVLLLICSDVHIADGIGRIDFRRFEE